MHDEKSFLRVLREIRDELTRIANAIETHVAEELDFEEDEEDLDEIVEPVEVWDVGHDAIGDIDAGVDDVFDRFDKEDDK